MNRIPSSIKGNLKSIQDEQILAEAISFHQANQLTSAQEGYHRFIHSNPAHAQANHLLGILYRQLKQYQPSIKYLSIATQLKPDELAYNRILIATYLENNQLIQAIDLGNSLLESDKIDDEILVILAQCLFQGNDASTAVTHLKSALTINPENWHAWLTLGNYHLTNEQQDKALTCYKKVLEIEPGQVDANNNSGVIYLNNKAYVSALELFVKVTEAMPEHAVAWCNMASCLLEMGHYQEAISSCHQSLSLIPDYPDAQYILARAYYNNRNFEKSMECYQQLIKQGVRSAKLFNSLGNLYEQLTDYSLATACYQKALVENSEYIEAKYNLGIISFRQKNYNEAVHYLTEVIEQDNQCYPARAPLLHALRQCCRWQEADQQADICRELLVKGVDVEIPPFSIITLEDSDYDEQLAVARHWLKTNRISLKNKIKQPLMKSNKRLRIGYLSADFHEHATAYLLIRVFELHDRSRFEVFAYSYGPDDKSVMRQRLEAGFENFKNCERLNNQEIANLIRSDQIDILFDLKGFTQNTRSQLLALHPAPIQINYLGYPATMGNSLVDYVISDHFLSETNEQQFEEQVIFMPDCYQPTDDTRVLAISPSRADVGLPESGVIFGAFHQNYKINRKIFRAWCNILEATPESILWCLVSNTEAQNNLLKLAEESGIIRERIVFAEHCSQELHLSRLQLVDLILDTYPVNGHTSTSDALWAGVPVITISGKSFISRVAGSLLHCMNLDGLICNSIEQYQALAIKLGNEQTQLDRLKGEVKKQKVKSPLFNTRAYTRNLESIILSLFNSKSDS